MDLLTSGHSKDDRLKTKKLFKEIIDLHIKIQRIFADVADIMSATIFLQLLSGIIFVASILFELDSVSIQSTTKKYYD